LQKYIEKLTYQRGRFWGRLSFFWKKNTDFSSESCIY